MYLTPSITALFKRANHEAIPILLCSDGYVYNKQLLEILNASSLSAITFNAAEGIMAVVVKSDKSKKRPKLPNFEFNRGKIYGDAIFLAVDQEGRFSSLTHHQSSIIDDYMSKYKYDGDNVL